MKKLKRLIGLGTRIALSNIQRSPMPFKLTFILTYRCDCRCQMCNIWQRKVENEMTERRSRSSSARIAASPG